MARDEEAKDGGGTSGCQAPGDRDGGGGLDASERESEGETTEAWGAGENGSGETNDDDDDDDDEDEDDKNSGIRGTRAEGDDKGAATCSKDGARERREMEC